jgi:hypothetical protein
MMDIGAIEQRTDRRNQHHIVGANQFAQVLFSWSIRRQHGPRHVNRFVPLPRSPALSIVISQG